MALNLAFETVGSRPPLAVLLAAASRAEVQGRLQQAVPDPGVVRFLIQNLVTHDRPLQETTTGDRHE